MVPQTLYHGEILRQWAHGVRQGFFATPVLRQLYQFAGNKLSRLKRPWRGCSSPIDAYLLTCRELEFT
eukprot:1076884-Prorocentrum_lima.AAC.1